MLCSEGGPALTPYRATARRQARTGHQGGGTGRTAGACFVLRVGLLSPTAPPPDDKQALATKAAAPGALLELVRVSNS